jgi:hypothetical protein
MPVGHPESSAANGRNELLIAGWLEMLRPKALCNTCLSQASGLLPAATASAAASLAFMSHCVHVFGRCAHCRTVDWVVTRLPRSGGRQQQNAPAVKPARSER